MILMVHANPVRSAQGVVTVDRKFHNGMLEYVERLGTPIVSLHPHLTVEQESKVMDLVRIPEAQLGYRVMTFDDSFHGGKVSAQTRERLADLIGQSSVVYGGGSVIMALARSMRVPAVCIVEYNFRTALVFATEGVESLLSRAARGARVAHYYVRDQIPSMRRAVMLHCNGYPIFEESRWFNKNRLLYLDSRMRTDMLILEEELGRRLINRRDRAVRLIFSGRFEPAKGALDVAKVAEHCAARGLKFTLDMYGQGSQREEILAFVKRANLESMVRVHEPVEYPELLKVTKDSDLFVCCHVQDDPSCTYLEAMGCGIPIAGYSNKMWTSMQADSGAGILSPVGDATSLANEIAKLCNDPNRLDALSLRARAFASAHTFEREFSRRTTSLLDIVHRRT